MIIKFPTVVQTYTSYAKCSVYSKTKSYFLCLNEIVYTIFYTSEIKSLTVFERFAWICYIFMQWKSYSIKTLMYFRYVGCAILACDFRNNKNEYTFKNHKICCFCLIDNLMGDQVVLWYVFNITARHNSSINNISCFQTAT